MKEKERLSQIQSAFAELIKVEKKLVDIQEKISAAIKPYQDTLTSLGNLQGSLKASLQSLIPENAALAGVFHKVTSKPSISYGKYSDFLIENLIPKTKKPDAMAAKAQFTSYSAQHSFKASE